VCICIALYENRLQKRRRKNERDEGEKRRRNEKTRNGIASYESREFLVSFGFHRGNQFARARLVARDKSKMPSVRHSNRKERKASDESARVASPTRGAPVPLIIAVDEGRPRATTGTTENRRRNDSSRRRATSRDTEIDIIDVTRLQRTSSWRRNYQTKSGAQATTRRSFLRKCGFERTIRRDAAYISL